jgi:hypothetical protein
MMQITSGKPVPFRFRLCKSSRSERQHKALSVLRFAKAREASDRLKPGAQAPGTGDKNRNRAREAGDSAAGRFARFNAFFASDPGACAPGFMLSPASRASHALTHFLLLILGLRPRLYAVARFAGFARFDAFFCI